LDDEDRDLGAPANGPLLGTDHRGLQGRELYLVFLAANRGGAGAVVVSEVVRARRSYPPPGCIGAHSRHLPGCAAADAPVLDVGSRSRPANGDHPERPDPGKKPVGSSGNASPSMPAGTGAVDSTSNTGADNWRQRRCVPSLADTCSHHCRPRRVRRRRRRVRRCELIAQPTGVNADRHGSSPRIGLQSQDEEPIAPSFVRTIFNECASKGRPLGAEVANRFRQSALTLRR
jgi:hypothetical protein